MNKALMLLTAIAVCLAFTAIPAVAAEKPVVTLERVEVANIQPFFIKPKIMVPSKEDPKKEEEKEQGAGFTSTLGVAYILNVKNTGKAPVMLDELQFTVTFDGFEVNTVTSYEKSWICPGKTNQIKILSSNEAVVTIGNLMVGSGNAEKIKEMKSSAGALVKKWWTAIPDFSFPIGITNGTASFVDEKGKTERVAFEGKFGKAPEAAPKK